MNKERKLENVVFLVGSGKELPKCPESHAGEHQFIYFSIGITHVVKECKDCGLTLKCDSGG